MSAPPIAELPERGSYRLDMTITLAGGGIVRLEGTDLPIDGLGTVLDIVRSAVRNASELSPS